ncbi:branched-chain amino acid transporter AzlC [Meridianimarinicoccus roseus]|uniref:Branched-chain amino acid transporter AzlC n=1 Tax=Meridianimarinicoccus roseus TaxID=2072018 RepID=A0A2V2LF24_9RHOB|nr:AzlC family ABC transporter permease [Meridianimarinicoccus roseus]PWR01787.1 branched-chain amino acid transporter AzlC [Meridianimarinicoccus roseus]
MRGAAPFILVIAPFGLLFGVIGTEAGLNIAQVMGFTVLVIAGAAQFTAVQLMVDNAPTVIVLATALAVNLRMAMYSASLVPHLGRAPLWQRALVAYGLVDQSYAVSILEFERTAMPLPERFAFFMGSFLVISPFWYAATLVGAQVGTAIPDSFALDFAIPITFLALIAPALRTLPHIVAALVSTLAALALAGLPYGTGLLLAAVTAMAAGAATELAMERRA